MDFFDGFGFLCLMERGLDFCVWEMENCCVGMMMDGRCKFVNLKCQSAKHGDSVSRCWNKAFSSSAVCWARLCWNSPASADDSHNFPSFPFLVEPNPRSPVAIPVRKLNGLERPPGNIIYPDFDSVPTHSGDSTPGYVWRCGCCQRPPTWCPFVIRGVGITLCWAVEREMVDSRN